jgi:hypothetical protein
MPYKNPYPPVRISPIAKLHLASIVEAMKSKGLRTSEASFLTNLILSQPIPNGNGNNGQEQQPRLEMDNKNELDN